MKTYKQRKNELREKAIQTFFSLSHEQTSWEEIIQHCITFELKAKRLGLLTEFRENGLI